MEFEFGSDKLRRVNDQRSQFLSRARSVVVKLGTQLLSDKDRRLDAGFIAAIAGQIASLRQQGIRITVVSSGAIGAGMAELNLAKRPTDLAKLQAVAAIGQRRLMDFWASAFAPFGLHVAQVLLTREDIDHRTRFLNLRNTLAAVHEFSAVPIINENDTVSTDEIVKITFGDNDLLAALVTHAIRAEVLVLLTVVDGILDNNGKPVRFIETAKSAQDLVRADKSALGKGGMTSKVTAAQKVTSSGDVLIVADGRMPDILPRLLSGEELGTLFAPAARKQSARSRWIGSARPVGAITVDAGAAKALIEKNGSLLAAGIRKVEGDFHSGDIVSIQREDGSAFAHGLSNYSSTDIQRIAGKKSSEVRSMLAEAAYDEVVHRDNLVLD
jgi:glutamate 5-kinase